MARSCGLRIGPSRFELVVLDGSPRKHKIAAYLASELPDQEDGVHVGISALREAAKKYNIPRDNVGVAIDTGCAAFRTLRLPINDRSKIEQVIKFEVESQLSQWNIDDVVVDFHVLQEVGESSELLVTAVPKDELGRVITMCDKAGIEPLECELETTAMVNAALAADICQVGSAQILVHIGELSTSVVVMDGGGVREMRAIHIGALTHLAGMQPQENEDDETEGDAETTPSEDLLTEVDPLEAQLRLDQSIKRIRRELGRTISAARTAHPIEGIFVCGFELPGLIGSTLMDVPVYILDAFEEDGGQPVEGFGNLVVPYGVAIRQLGGGVLKPSLRREELRYAGKFEKLELPLAVVCLLMLTFLGVWNIFLFREWQMVDDAMGVWRNSTTNYMLGSMKYAGYLEYPPEKIKSYVKNIDEDDIDRNKHEQLMRIKFLLNEDIRQLEKDLGQDAEITQPQSALRGMAAVLDIFERNKSDIGRPSLRKIEATYQPGRPPNRPEHVRVQMDLTFFAESSLDATQNYEEGFIRQIEREPWYLELKRPQSETLEDGKGIYLQGLAVSVDVAKLNPEKETEKDG